MTDDTRPPQWAIDKADRLLGETDPRAFGDGYRHPLAAWVATTFARYIAEHEQPPVDPLLVEAREIVASDAERRGYSAMSAKAIREGTYCEDEVSMALTGLRRGIEIAGERKP